MFESLHSSLSSLFSHKDDSEKITCYHCGEKSRKKDTVYVKFEGEIRPVCCYGCAAVLKTVEELDMHEEYRNSRINIPGVGN